jgi:hypothetical protein
MPKEKRSRLAPLSINSRNLSALNPGIKRNAQAKRFLTGSSFGALKRPCNFASAGPFSSERLQGSHIGWRPGTTFSIFHYLSPSCERRRILQKNALCQHCAHITSRPSKQSRDEKCSIANKTDCCSPVSYCFLDLIWAVAAAASSPYASPQIVRRKVVSVTRI